MILFQDDDWLVVDKPPLSLVIPGRGAPRRVLRTELEAQHGRLWVVHRLDWGVGGVLLFARTAAAHRHASMQFEGRKVEKHYEAWTHGTAPSGTQRWTWPLRRGKKRAYVHDGGKPSETLGTAKAGSPHVIWSLKPLTGRNHQLRVHLMTAGFPILGDALYGGPPWDGEGLALWSVALSGPGLPTVRRGA